MMNTNCGRWSPGPGQTSRMGLGLLTLFVLALAETAFGHAGHDAREGGMVYGFLHPLTGIDHVIAMVAVGLWGAQLGGAIMWTLPVCFPLLMAVGAALGVRGVPLPAPEVFIALSGVALGAAVLMAWRAPKWAALLMVGAFALFHGHAHGSELPEAASPIGFGLGFVIGTGLLHLAGIGLGTVKGWRPTGPWLIRAAGAVVAVMGCYFLFQAIPA